jgi:hypothetical protein
VIADDIDKLFTAEAGAFGQVIDLRWQINVVAAPTENGSHVIVAGAVFSCASPLIGQRIYEVIPPADLSQFLDRALVRDLLTQLIAHFGRLRDQAATLGTRP